MLNIPRVAQYARFSSDNQRSESIDAQIRAMNQFCLIVNEWEAQAVRIIFQMFAYGYGYSEIIERLNAYGYKTKRGKMFGKNSLYEILSNEKYTGVLYSTRQLRE